MTDTITIRKIGPDDLHELQTIAKQTFYDTFETHNTEENMQQYLNEGFTEEKLTAELYNNHSDFYFALSENKTVGYLKLNFGKAQTELQNDNAVEIERIYVFKEFHGKKAGQILYEKALETAAAKNADYIWLGVWEENPRAIQFYKKNGFVEFDQHIFRFGNEEQTDIMMKLELHP